jgi:hypothetical protein
MKRVAIIPIIIVFLLSACGGAAATEAPELQPPTAKNSAAPLPSESTVTQALPTATFIVFSTPGTATPTETLLPPLNLPSQAANAPSLAVWDGQPTYPGDSKPGYSFRVKYDPDLWALTTDNYGFPAIGHRRIGYCVMAPASGGGLPSNMRVDHDIRRIGEVSFVISAAYSSDGIEQFVTYSGGDGNIYTGFQLTFQQEIEACIRDAEAVLATLNSVSEAQATPATPGP